MIDDLLNSTQPILYETGNESFPYAYSGTCYPIKYKGSLFIVSAYHCYKNLGILPEQTLYQRPEKPSSFFSFDIKTRGRAEQAKDDEHYDQVLLRVARKHHSQSEMDAVVAIDVAKPGNALLPTSTDIIDLQLRGYPWDAPKHEIDYDKKKIAKQAYWTNGCVGAGQAPCDFCYSIKMLTPIPTGMHPNGMSGSPLYGINRQREPVYCGTIIRYNEITGEYIAIGPEVLVNTLKGL